MALSSTTFQENTPVTRTTRSGFAALLLALPAVAISQDTKNAAQKLARPSIYDEKADAKEQIKTATALARRDARRVLVMFGFNGCGWCHKLHGLFASDKDIRTLLADEYVLAMVDVQAQNADDLLRDCKTALSREELQKGMGYPFLAVLDGSGRVVTAQRTDPLEVGDHHDSAQVKAFLEKWVAPKVVASKVFEEGLAKASTEDKLVFLHFGAPWCGWCHQLDAFLARDDIAPILGREFIDVKLDLDRMTGAREIFNRYNAGTSGGIPWFVFLDPRGTAIVTSEGPKGNIGYPATPEGIEHFIVMLKKAARKLDRAQIEMVEAALKAERIPFFIAKLKKAVRKPDRAQIESLIEMVEAAHKAEAKKIEASRANAKAQ
jgi:thioredoxin-related protein